MNDFATGDAPTTTSTSLLERIRYRDHDAWRRFVPLYAPAIYELCRRSGIQASDADDVTQEVLQAISQSIGQFRKERPGDSFRGWLYRVTQNKIRDHFRRSERHPPSAGGTDFQVRLQEVPESSALLDESLSEAANTVALSRALELIRNDFQPHIWQAFWRITVKGERAVDIASELGLTPNGVRQAKFRVVQRIRAEFGDLLEL